MRTRRMRMRRMRIRKTGASPFALCLGVMLILGLGLWLAPTQTMAADANSPIVGTWEGTFDPGAQPKKQIVVHIAAGQDGSLSGTIDFPDQGTSGTLITAITYKQSVLHFESSSALILYDGAMNKENTEISGSWTEGQVKANLVLKRTA
jgi:hypothetical protein